MAIPKTLDEQAKAVMSRWASKFPSTRAGQSCPIGVAHDLIEDGWTGSEVADAAKHCSSCGWTDKDGLLTKTGYDKFWR